MNIKAIIPARGGSKSIPHKNIAMLGGMPLIYYSIKTAREVFGEEVYVSTDDQKIADIASALGAKIVYRPSEFAADTATDYGWVKHAFVETKAEAIAILRPTTPFRHVDVVRRAKEDFLAHLVLGNHEVSSMRSAHEINEHPYKCVMDNEEYWIPFGVGYLQNEYEALDLPRQSFVKVYAPNGYIDFTIKKTIDRGTIYGRNILKYITPKTIDIDTKEDLLLANLYCNGFIN